MSAKTVSIETARNIMLGIGLLGILGIFAVVAVPVPNPAKPARQFAAPPVAPVVARVTAVAPAGITPINARRAPSAPAAAPAAYRITSFLNRPEQFQHGDFIWNDEGIPAGPVLVTIDIGTQLIHVFRSGREIGTAVILYGADDSPTPLGTFPILDKDVHHVSSIFGAPMPYNLRLTGDGVAVHGSTHLQWGWATNGCIGVPVPFAKLLFGQVKVGDRVIVSRGKTPAIGAVIPLT